MLLGTRPFYDLLNRIDVLETNEITSELRLNQTKKICQSKSAGVSCTSRKQRWTHNLCAPRNDPNIISKSTTDSWDAPFYMSKYQYQGYVYLISTTRQKLTLNQTRRKTFPVIRRILKISILSLGIVM